MQKAYAHNFCCLFQPVSLLTCFSGPVRLLFTSWSYYDVFVNLLPNGVYFIFEHYPMVCLNCAYCCGAPIVSHHPIKCVQITSNERVVLPVKKSDD